jgi:3-hydroxyacyl-[acyl-carrier-protein] dehydratase
MRWFWVDRFVEFESGTYAKAVKNVSLAEEHLHDHFPGFAVMPGSLILEGLAQTGGILLGESQGFRHLVVLAKVPRIRFHSWACPGDTLTYAVKLLDSREEGGSVEATAYVGERLVAEAEILFAHADQLSGQIPQAAHQRNFVFELGLLDILEVGRAGDGRQAAPAAETAGSASVPAGD